MIMECVGMGLGTQAWGMVRAKNMTLQSRFGNHAKYNRQGRADIENFATTIREIRGSIDPVGMAFDAGEW